MFPSGPVYGNESGVSCVRMQGRKHRRFLKIPGRRASFSLPAEHHVGTGGLPHVQPDLAGAGVVEGEGVIVACPSAHADLDP